MSSDQQQERFRSRSKQRKQRQQTRRKILESLQQNKIKNKNHAQMKESEEQQKKHFKIQEYKGISQQAKHFKKQQQSSGEDMDMFGDNLQIMQNKKQKNTKNQMTDQQGYYIVTQGTTINEGKYKIISKIGKGMFGTVVKACKTNQKSENINSQNEVFAIKIARNNSVTLQSGQRQYKILSEIKKSQYIMKIYDYFFQGEHLCIVCEMMGEDLRSYVRKHQSEITLQKIKQFAISIFMSLHQLRKNKIIHADIKPDNFLLTTDEKYVKLSDFGTSYHVEEHSSQIDQLVARYYRAPQIILGYEMTTQNRHGIDTWAAACSLYQLYTGQFLFNGSSNNEMLKLMMETKGKFNIKMLKNSNFYQKHFDNQYNFIYDYYDKSTKSNLKKKMQISITHDRQLLNMLKKYCRQNQDPKNLHNFKDFLQRCLTLNPKDRLTPQQAFMHPFLNYQVKLD